MKDEFADKLTEKEDPQSRLAAAKLTNEEFTLAQALLKQGQFKEALKKFKWAFANDPSSKLFLPRSSISKLCKNYAPATKAVRRWRNDKEKLLTDQGGDFTLIQQWDTLNECLGEKDRTLNVFMRMQTDKADEKLLSAIRGCIWQRLARARRYDLLKDHLYKLGFRLLLNAVQHDSLVLFPTHRKMSKKQRGEEFARHIEFALNDGALSCEVAFGLGDKRVAAVFIAKLLSIECSDRVYAALIKAAIRARSYSDAVAIYREAKEKFSSRQLRQSNKVIKTLPKRQLALLNN